MSVVSIDGQRSFSDLCHIYILLQILISSVRSSEADIVSTSLNFTSDKSIPVFVNNTQTDKGSAVKSSNIIVLNKVNETISALKHKTHRRTYFNQTAGINLIGSSTNSNLSNQAVFNNLSYNGIISSPLTSSDLLRIARTINTATTTAAIIIQRRDDNSQQICNEKTHEGCKVQNFERCTKSGNCECMRGYMFSRKTGLCAAVQYFWANIYIKRQPLLNVELNELSGGYQKLEEQLKRELLSIFPSQRLPGLLDVQIVHIIWKPTYVEVNFRISVEKSDAPSVEEIEKIYKKGLAETQNNGTYVYIRWDQLEGLNNKNKITEYNHCQDSSYNYCSVNAICKHYMKSFLCKCNPDYDDISPDIVRAPGEICTIGCSCKNNGTCNRSNNRKVCRCPATFSGDKCEIKLHVANRCSCQNNGTCQLNNGKVTCECPTWFLGEKCEVNGKLLVIILCSTLGGLLFLTLLICILCIFVYRRKTKKRNNKTANARQLSTSESTLVKLPRFWTEAGSPQVYEVPVSPDRRRWSFVSDPVRYPEDLILEDHYRPGTLPLPKFYDTNRRHLMAYQNPSFQSSTLPLRPAYQQDKWRSYYPAPRSVAY